jgi:hypothetical protein
VLGLPLVLSEVGTFLDAMTLEDFAVDSLCDIAVTLTNHEETEKNDEHIMWPRLSRGFHSIGSCAGHLGWL